MPFYLLITLVHFVLLSSLLPSFPLRSTFGWVASSLSFGFGCFLSMVGFGFCSSHSFGFDLLSCILGFYLGFGHFVLLCFRFCFGWVAFLFHGFHSITFGFDQVLRPPIKAFVGLRHFLRFSFRYRLGCPRCTLGFVLAVPWSGRFNLLVLAGFFGFGLLCTRFRFVAWHRVYFSLWFHFAFWTA